MCTKPFYHACNKKLQYMLTEKHFQYIIEIEIQFVLCCLKLER